MHSIIKHKQGKYEKRACNILQGCECSDCKTFIDYKTEAYFHSIIKGLVLCTKCKPAGKLKYHNSPKEYDGEKYQSTLEANYASRLDLKVKAGLIKGWKRQIKIPLNIKFIDGQAILTNEPELSLKQRNIKFIHIYNYWMDFVVEHLDGTTEYVETKGAELEPWKTKIILTEAILNQEIADGITKLTVVKEQQYKLKRKSNAGS